MGRQAGTCSDFQIVILMGVQAHDKSPAPVDTVMDVLMRTDFSADALAAAHSDPAAALFPGMLATLAHAGVCALWLALMAAVPARSACQALPCKRVCCLDTADQVHIVKGALRDDKDEAAFARMLLLHAGCSTSGYMIALMC